MAPSTGIRCDTLRSSSIDMLAVVLVAAGLALALNGCGSSPTPSPPSAKKTSVLMMRHCIRSMPEKAIWDVPNMSYFANYSKDPWPEFNVPAFYCTANGEAIIEEQGNWFRSNGDLPIPFKIIADDVERDNVTAHAFLKGLGASSGVDGTSFQIDKNPFSYNKTPTACHISTSQKKVIIEGQLKAYPQPSSFSALYKKIFDIAGVGPAGDWTKAHCEVTEDAINKHYWAPVVGGCNVADEFMERFLMEWGTQQKVGWGRLNTSEIPALLAVHAWYFRVALMARDIQKVQASSIAWSILQVLEAGEQGTTAFVGHDTQQGALSSILGISWKPSPWPENATTPGSSIRFDRDGDSDSVSVSFLYNDNFSSGHDMKSVRASGPNFHAGNVSLKYLRELVENNTVKACANQVDDQQLAPVHNSNDLLFVVL